MGEGSNPGQASKEGVTASQQMLFVWMCRVVSMLHSCALLFGELVEGDHFLPIRCSLGPPKTMKEALISWRDSFMGKRRRKIWKSIPLCIFWTVWKERDHIAFRDETLVVQKL